MDGIIGEIRPFAFTYAPQSWILCDGREVQVIQYQALYAILGNTFGGTPNSTFKLPNLQGQAVMGFGAGPGLTTQPFGHAAGASTVQLTQAQMPNHTHDFNGATGAANSRVSIPVNTDYLTNTGYGAANATTFTTANGYTNVVPDAGLNPAAVSIAGGVAGTNAAAAHENKQPYLTIEYCICWEGVWPSRN